ncbi:MAG: cytochrome ubiquinol oxidase subunit I [Desulfurococcales archaeon]|nr:cytochrome ubiquinol oxidase subunit I [Desulfurococcales archaeon]
MAEGLLGQWLHAYPAGHLRVLSLVGIEVHWAILQYVLGLSFLAFVARLIYLRTHNEHWERLTRTLVKGFILMFALGAATGTAAEFGLVLLWPNLTEAAGDFIYFPLYAEIFAFIMEVVFLYMMWYGWGKLSLKAHTAILFLGMAGAWYSAAMIVSVNAYMVAPTGIMPAYNTTTWHFMYAEGYPKFTLHVPLKLILELPNGSKVSIPTLKLLNIPLLEKAGMTVVGMNKAGNAVVVEMPVRIVQRLVFEMYRGYTVKDSILQFVVNKTYVQEHASLAPILLNTPVKSIVEPIVKQTVRDEGVYSVTFKSPVYWASIIHVYGAAVTTSAFTLMGAYAIRYLQYRNRRDEDYLEYVRKAFAFAAVTGLIVIAVQGLVLGHEMGRAIAIYNPEKLAAMEATTSQLKHTMTGPFRSLFEDKLMPLLAYGSMHAKLPSYDAIPKDYCYCKLSDKLHQMNPSIPSDAMRGLVDCRPPLIVHYLYYGKVYLAVLLGLYALAAVYYVWRGWPNFNLPGWISKPGYAMPILIQLVSFLGWATREIGRKPWTIYGVMTVDTAQTVNPPSTGEVTLVAVYLIGLLILLAYGVYRILWVPGNPEKA